jgi:hypothetical protein
MIRLIVNGVEADIKGGEQVVISRSANDIQEIEKRQGDYTNTFLLPNSVKNRGIFADADQVNALSEIHYKANDAILYAGGVEYRGNIFVLNTSDEGIEVYFTSGNADLFEAIQGKKLTDIDFSDLNHEYTRANIVASQNKTSGYIYPIADYHIDSPNTYITATGTQVIDPRTIYPAIYLRTIIERIFNEAGFSYNGNFFDEVPEYFKLTLPLLNVRDLPTPEYMFINRQITVIQKYQINRGGLLTVPFSDTVFDPWGFWKNSAYHPYDVNFTGQIMVVAQTNNNIGFTGAKLRLFEDEGVGTTATLLQEVDIPLAQSQVEILQSFSHTKTGVQKRYYVRSFNPDSLDLNKFIELSASFQIVDVQFPYSIQYNTTLDVNRLMPDILQSDIIKMVWQMYNVVPITDNRVVEWFYFKKILSNEPDNWSNYIDESTRPVVNRVADGYAQTNYFKYKDDKDIIPGFGDGVFEINNEGLEREKTVIQFPVSYSETTFRHNGRMMAHIKMLEAGAQKQKAEQRLLVVRYEPETSVLFKEANEASGTVRKGVAYGEATKSGNELIEEHYSELVNMLKNYVEVNQLVRLSHADVSQADFRKPVFIKKYNATFYKCAINQHDLTSNDSTEVKLIKI